MTVNELYSVFSKHCMEVEYRTKDNFRICETNYWNTREMFGNYQIEEVMISNSHLIILLKDWEKEDETN